MTRQGTSVKQPAWLLLLFVAIAFVFGQFTLMQQATLSFSTICQETIDDPYNSPTHHHILPFLCNSPNNSRAPISLDAGLLFCGFNFPAMDGQGEVRPIAAVSTWTDVHGKTSLWLLTRRLLI